jgi:general secretion pathway protein J
MYSRRTGFTLVELLMASTIGTFIALVAVAALRTLTTSSQMVASNIEAAAEVRFAANMIARDLLNIYREQDTRHMKFIGQVEDSGDYNNSLLTFYTVGRAKARAEQPESDVYEVEYYLRKDQETSFLFRRLHPNPDPNEEQIRGVLTAIAENIEVFEVRFFDGQEWTNEWSEEMLTVPQLVEVSIVARPPARGNPVMESITVNLVSSIGQTVAASEEGSEGGTGASQQGGQQTIPSLR